MFRKLTFTTFGKFGRGGQLFGQRQEIKCAAKNKWNDYGAHPVRCYWNAKLEYSISGQKKTFLNCLSGVYFSRGVFQQRRLLWGWLNSVFNRVDDSRIKEVGPDRACAEWLLRCGAGVKWDKGSDEWLKDYNSLPVGNYRALKIVEIDATDSAVMHIGFPHFRGLKHVRKAIFHRCGYMEDEAVRQIGYLKETLEELQISSCGNVTDEGILTLTQLTNLKKLTLYDFLEVSNRKHCLSVLQKSLPNCDIYFPFAKESDRDPPKDPEKSQEADKA